jgi:hypothetical protein
MNAYGDVLRSGRGVVRRLGTSGAGVLFSFVGRVGGPYSLTPRVGSSA